MYHKWWQKVKMMTPGSCLFDILLRNTFNITSSPFVSLLILSKYYAISIKRILTFRVWDKPTQTKNNGKVNFVVQKWLLLKLAKTIKNWNFDHYQKTKIQIIDMIKVQKSYITRALWQKIIVKIIFDG